VGAGTAFFLDPHLGKRRRSLLVDRARGVFRRAMRVGIRKVKFAGGHARGVMALTSRFRKRATDDRTVEQRIRSDAFRDIGVSTRDVDVAVENGLARLSGSIESITLADELVSRVREVPGVREVSAELQVAET
jgi:osmotically-inducible protein OsmY